MKIAVTGGAGMIGSNFVRYLNKYYPDAKVWIYDQMDTIDSKFKNIRDLKFEGIIRDAWTLLCDYECHEEYDFVFHFAADSSTDCKAVDAQRDYDLTERLSSEWKERLIFASSAGVYGNDGETPLTWYAFFKKKAEEKVLENGGTAFRLFNVFGPGEELKPGQNSPFYRYTMALKNREKIVMYDESERRDFVPVLRVCRDMTRIIEHPRKYSGSWFDCGTGHPMSFGEVLDYVVKTISEQKKVHFSTGVGIGGNYAKEGILARYEIEHRKLGRETQKNTCAKKFITQENRDNTVNYYFTSFYLEYLWPNGDK